MAAIDISSTPRNTLRAHPYAFAHDYRDRHCWCWPGTVSRIRCRPQKDWASSRRPCHLALDSGFLTLGSWLWVLESGLLNLGWSWIWVLESGLSSSWQISPIYTTNKMCCPDKNWCAVNVLHKLWFGWPLAGYSRCALCQMTYICWSTLCLRELILLPLLLLLWWWSSLMWLFMQRESIKRHSSAWLLNIIIEFSKITIQFVFMFVGYIVSMWCVWYSNLPVSSLN